jgi:hypothetical protein
MADYFIRIYVSEEFNDQMDRIIASPDHFSSIPEAVQGTLVKLGIPNSSVEWDIQ